MNRAPPAISCGRPGGGLPGGAGRARPSPMWAFPAILRDRVLGRTIGGRYAIVRQLGAGGMGAVYEARHTGTGRRVAIKVITADLAKDPQLVARFEREALAAGAIDSEHIVQVFDVGTD